MEIKVDCQLNNRKYGVVERTIFRLVLRGINAAQGISELLWIFSDSVKAVAIQKLVNNQILRADIQSNRLYLSDGMIAVLNACNQSHYSLDLTDVILERKENGQLIIDDTSTEAKPYEQIVNSILSNLVPRVDLEPLKRSLVFSMQEVECEHGKQILE